MNCVNCGAPLKADSNVCTFCETLNDVDLRAIRRNIQQGPETDRTCPRCARRLHGVELRFAAKMFLEQCDQCFGLFFDPGELETVLDESVARVYEVDLVRLKNLTEEENAATFDAVSYSKCPMCGELMNRRIFGKRSGVIVDVCKGHGVWLDGGELVQLLKWIKAGGQMYHDHRVEEEQRAAERAKKKRTVEPSGDGILVPIQPGNEDLLVTIIRSLFRVFR